MNTLTLTAADNGAPAPAARTVWRRLRADDGFSDLPVVVGLVAAAGALGAAISGLNWNSFGTTFETVVTDAVTKAKGTP